MNDHLNENLLPEEELSTEELLLLKDALNSFCPPPKHSVRDAVMEQIRRERAADRMRRLRSRFVKIGSLAACIAVVAAAGIRVLPALTSKSAEMAADNATDSIEAFDMTAEAYSDVTAGENGSDTILFSTFMTSAETGAAVSEDAAKAMPETAAPTAEAQTDTIPPASNSVSGAEPEAETVPETAAPVKMMSSGPKCKHLGVFFNSYHNIPDALIAAAGEDVYLAWLSEASGCSVNIADFLYYMEANTPVLISDIEMLYDAGDLWYQYDRNFDLLSAGDIGAVEEYYRNGGDFAGMVKRATEYRFKLDLLVETDTEMTAGISQWSIADLVRSEEISTETLTTVYEACADSIEAEYPGYAAQEYDLEALYSYAVSDENDEPEPPSQIAPGRSEDAMFHADAENPN